MKKNLMVATQSGFTFNVLPESQEELFESFRKVKEWGFDGIDYGIDRFVKGNTWIGEYDRFFEKSLEELYEFFGPTKEAAEKYDIAFPQMHGPYPMYIEGKADFNEYMMMATEKCIAISSFFDCPVIVVHPYVCPDKEKQEQINFDIYRKLIPTAKKYGVKICLENLSGLHLFRYIEGVCSSAEEVNNYIDTLNAEAGEELFGFCLDVGHANVHAKDMNWFIRKLGKRLFCLHIHDNNGVQDQHMLPFTQVDPGTDWEGVISGLRAIEYTGAISFEAFNGVKQMPEDVRSEVHKLLSAIGRYFQKRISE